jgi:methionyl-tRNA synthetase
MSGAPLTLKATKHWFLLLDKFKDKLTTWLAGKNWKPNVVNFVKGYIDELRPRAITRDMTWGVPIPLPGTEGKVLYVWFDAPIGYISASIEWAEKSGQPERWKEYWCDPQTKLVHFIGKDNIPFHAVIFPAMTMGQNQPFKLVDELPANEFYNLEGRQFSKSDGWYIDLEAFFQTYTTDQIRYAIAANMPETSDSEFTWKDFQLKCNTDLLGKYGNLVNRILVFAKNHCAGVAPKHGALQAIDTEFLNNIKNLVSQAAEAYEAFKVRRASQLVMELAQLGNVYFDAKKPWTDAKQPDTRLAMETTIWCCLQCLKALALISSPIIPETADKVWKLIGYQTPLNGTGWERIAAEELPAGQRLQEPQILFQKVEDTQIETEMAKLKAMAQKAVVAKSGTELAPLKSPVDIDDVKKLDLRVGTVLTAKPVPKSKKLLELTVDIGLEKRTIISGISQSYSPEQIIGKKVIVVANLKPATLMGVESCGMLLAGHDGPALETISVQHLSNGSVVS